MEAIIEYDTKGLLASDIYLIDARLPGWGTAMAIQMGYEWHKTMFAFCPSSRPSVWLRHRVNKVFINVEDAIMHLLCL